VGLHELSNVRSDFSRSRVPDPQRPLRCEWQPSYTGYTPLRWGHGCATLLRWHTGDIARAVPGSLEYRNIMVKFPERESEIVTLAQNMIDGLNANKELYPAPVLSPADLETTLNKLKMAQKQFVAARAAVELACADKNAILKELVEQLKSDIRIAESVVKWDDNKLKLLGWGGRAQKTTLPVPGAAYALKATRISPGVVKLSWKRSRGGGKVAAYEVQKFDAVNQMWQNVATAIETETLLVNQPVEETLQYRVTPVNRTGAGTASDVVRVVL